MTWIRTVPLTDANAQLRKAMEDQKLLYPKEYAMPVHPVEGGGSQIVASHSLSPSALPRLRDLWRSHVTRFAARPPPTRNDHDHGIRHQPVRLLNRLSRRVSASRNVG